MASWIKDRELFLLVYVLFFVLGIFLIAIWNKGDFIFLLNDYRFPFLDSLFQFMSFIVETPIFIGLTIIFLFIDYRWSIQIGASGILTLILSQLFKYIFALPRPMIYFEQKGLLKNLILIDEYTPLTGFTSFPSGHTTAAFAIFLSLAFCFKKKYLDIVFVIIAVFAGLSRVYLVNHFLMDILAGSFLGCFIAILVQYVIIKLNFTEKKIFTRRQKWV